MFQMNHHGKVIKYIFITFYDCGATFWLNYYYHYFYLVGIC